MVDVVTKAVWSVKWKHEHATRTKKLEHNQTPKSYFPIHPISASDGRNIPENSEYASLALRSFFVVVVIYV